MFRADIDVASFMVGGPKVAHWTLEGSSDSVAHGELWIPAVKGLLRLDKVHFPLGEVADYAKLNFEVKVVCSDDRWYVNS